MRIRRIAPPSAVGARLIIGQCKPFSITSIPNNWRPSRCRRNRALILAGAGSGKTRVLTTRIAWLIQTGQVSPAGMLAVTFTNKAAKEMLTRLSAMLPINTRGMWIGTFHGLCNRLLRTHYRDAASAADLPDPGLARSAVDHQAPAEGQQCRR